MTKKILLIGGGTGGHIYPLRNLADELLKRNAQVELIVADQKLDREIIKENFTNIPVRYFKTGKIRRYLSLQNFLDFFLIIKSFFTARTLLKKINPDVIFFKGGFVGFPFLIAAKFLMNFKGQIFSHESDISPGFLTKLVDKWADKSFQSFSETEPLPLFYSPKIENQKLEIEDCRLSFDPELKTEGKIEDCYSPLSKGKSSEGSNRMKKLLFFGGSQGAKFINELFVKCHDKILEDYQVTLITGHAKKVILSHPNFEQFEIIPTKKLAQKIEEADLIVARAGSNSLFEIITAKKLSIIIPLPSVARNHQLKNALLFKEKNLCEILEEKNATPDKLIAMISATIISEKIKQALKTSNIKNSAVEIAQKILQTKTKN